MSEPVHTAGPFAPRHSPSWARLREATVELVVERGLDAVKPEALCARAQFDPAEFESDFGGVRGCALRVYLANIDKFDRALGGAVDPADPWRTRLRTTAYATARHIGDRLLSTRFDMIAMLEGRELAQAHRDRYVRWLIDLIDEGRQELPDPSALGPATAEGVFGSIYRMLMRELVGEGGSGRAEEVVPQLMYLAVRPYMGEQAAREELGISPPATIGGVRR